MVHMGKRIASVSSSNRSMIEPDRPAWLQLPPWPNMPTEIQVPQHHSIANYEAALARHDPSSAAILRQINMSGLYIVNLADNSCTCSEWQRVKKVMPTRDLRRVCKHIVKAVLHRKAEFSDDWNEWTLRILHSINDGFSYGVFASFTDRLFDNENEQFLALYDNRRGYVELFDLNGGCFGYDAVRNRWANGIAPDKPLELKRMLRPWIKSLDTQFKSGELVADT